MNHESGSRRRRYAGTLANTVPTSSWWIWSTPAILALGLAGMSILIDGGEPAQTAYWPTQHAAFLMLNQAFSSLPPGFWAIITLLGDASILLLALAPFVLTKPQVWFALLASIPAGAMFSVFGKHWASVPRPASVIEPSMFNVIGPLLKHYALPSGHSVTAFAAAAALLATLVPIPRSQREWALVGCVVGLASLIAMSRVAVGAHWPLDLLTGAAGGWLSGLMGAALARRSTWWSWFLSGHGQIAFTALLLTWSSLLWLRPTDFIGTHVILAAATLCGIATSVGLLLHRGYQVGSLIWPGPAENVLRD
jgi:membrane-associated phospholipid phosphatase